MWWSYYGQRVQHIRKGCSKLESGCFTTTEALAHAGEIELNRILIEVNVMSQDKQLRVTKGRRTRAGAVS